MQAAAASAAKRIVPLLDRVLVRRLRPVDKTAAGILIPEKAQAALNRGEVVAVGPGTAKEPMTLRPGDTVLLPSYGGTAVDLGAGPTARAPEEEGYVLLRESEVLAKVEM